MPCGTAQRHMDGFNPFAFTSYAGIEPHPCDALYSVQYLLALLYSDVWACQSEIIRKSRNIIYVLLSMNMRIGIAFRLIKADFYMH